MGEPLCPGSMLTSNLRVVTWGCDPDCLVQAPFRAPGPKRENNRKNMGFGLPKKIGKNG